jgi:asparagine synthase (glutamine-hydrolysing)
VDAAAAGIDTARATGEGWWAQRRALAAGAAGMSELDFETYLVSILNRQDKMSMATSLEARVPFLDNEIIDFAAGLPVDFKQTLRHRKRVLKDVARRYLPTEIVDRRKSGFGVPLVLWMRHDGPMAELLKRTATNPKLNPFISGATLSRAIDEHRSATADHSEFLWSAINLGLWLEDAG